MSTPSKMKTANIMLRLDKQGHDVQLSNVTPAEVLLLVAEHHKNAGADPVLELKETDGVERSNQYEVNRLRGKYAGNKVSALFSGAMPTLPTTFDEARKAGIGISLPTNKLSETKG